MRLIIDIPDTTYAAVKELQFVNTGRGSCKTIQQTVINSIKFGIKQPQGKWLCDDKYLDCKCSICNSYALERGDYPELSPYCPQCGAYMEVITNGKEETT